MFLHNVIQTLFLLTGAVSLLASLLNWEWFFTTDNASFIVKRLGRNGARLAYGFIGLAFISAAIFFYYKIETI